MALLAKRSLEPWLAINVILLFARISICKREILDCNDQTSLEQGEAQLEPAESAEFDARYRKCIIRVPVNRTVRIKFKCGDENDLDLETECLQYFNISVFHNNAWRRNKDGLSVFETGEGLCITSKDVMISLTIDEKPFIRHVKALYEITDTDCDKIIQKKHPKVETTIQSNKASVLTTLQATYHQSQISEKKGRFSTRLLPTKSKKAFHFKTISKERYSMLKLSETTTLPVATTQLYKVSAKFKVTVPPRSLRNFQPVDSNKSQFISPVMTLGVLPSSTTSEYHYISKSTMVLNILPISSFREEIKIFPRESIGRHEQELSTASKNMNASDERSITGMNSRVDSIQKIADTIETSKAMKDKSLHNINTHILTSSITEPLFPSEAFVSQARSTMQFINKQEIIETENLHEVDRGRTANNLILSSKVSLATIQATPAMESSTRLINPNGPKSQSRKRANSTIESTQPFTKKSSLSLSEVTNGKNKDFSIGLGDQLMRTERDSSGIEQSEFNTKIKLTKLKASPQFTYRLGSKGYIFSFKSTASPLDGSRSLQFEYPSSLQINELKRNLPMSYSSKKDSSEREVYNWNSKRYTPSTKLQGSDLRASLTPNAIGDTIFSERHSSATKPMNSQSINEFCHPSVSSISAIFLQSHEQTGRTITQRYDQVQHNYKTSLKQTYISPKITVQNWSLKNEATERVQKNTRLTTSQRPPISSLTESWKNGFVAPSISVNDNIKSSSKPLNDRVIWFEKQMLSSLSSTRTPALYSSVKATPGNTSFNILQSLTDSKTEKPPLSLSANTALSTLSGFSSNGQQDIQAHSIEIDTTTQYKSLKDTAISGLYQTASSIFWYLTSSQSKEETKGLEQSLVKTRTTLISSSNGVKSKGDISFSTQTIINFKTKDQPIPYHSSSVDDARINSIHFPTSISQHSQQIQATHLVTTKSVPLSYLADGSLYTPLASNSRHQRISSLSEIYAETAPTIIKPSKSSNPSAKSTTRWEEFEDGCSYHFITNVNDPKADDELKFEVLDIMSLKIKQIIAVNWPYDGYLGRAGFIHRGLVVQTMDERLWYNHMQSNNNQLYIVYLQELKNLHRRVRVVYSQDLNGEGTLKEHVDSLGVNVGMYFRTCNSK